MATTRAQRKKPPRFASDADVVRFFDTHEATDVGVDVDEVFELDPELERLIRTRMRTRQVTLRLHEWMIESAKAVAARTGTPYQVLLKFWIAEGIHRTQQRFRATRSASRRRRRVSRT